jgi:hypothetical protein
MSRALLALEDFVLIPPVADAVDDDEALAFCLVVVVEVLDGVWYADCCLEEELSSELWLFSDLVDTIVADVKVDDVAMFVDVGSLIVLLVLLELLKFVSKSYKHGYGNLNSNPRL